ncbi:MAG: hypothetical protein JXA82_13285 [Sedimentisphaerales bacterium]|nr:hypothetical protein [Sedimentisphaerales bacterium]
MAKLLNTNTKEKYLFLCNDAVKKQRPEQKVIHIKTSNKREHDKIHLEIAALEEQLKDNLPDVMTDLLEIATLVYVAGQLTSRGGSKEIEYGYKWFRDFEMAIPVREYELWSDFQIKELLEEILKFVSGEKYEFHFTRKSKTSPELLGFKPSPIGDKDIEEVLLFSGGLDSFSGAVKEMHGEKKKVALVSHCSETKITGLQQKLYEYIANTCEGPNPLHVPAKIWKGGRFHTKDTHQRNRSFLYAALGAAVAKTIGLKRVRFYENGIISCNLPFDGQTYQARRTRTTHPRFLSKMSELVEELTKEDFIFENLYAYKTRVDVIQEIINLEHQDGIIDTRSCVKSRYEGDIRHDGVCSQCIDRRFATIAADCQQYDPQKRYKFNIFTDELNKIPDRTMALGFSYLADIVETFDLDAFTKYFTADLLEVANYIPLPNEEAIKVIYNLYKRFAKQFNQVLDMKLGEHPSEIRSGKWPKGCLLNMISHQIHKQFPQLAKHKETGKNKHGHQELDTKVNELLSINPYFTSGEIADEIKNTSASAVRQTYSWKNRKKLA